MIRDLVQARVWLSSCSPSYVAIILLLMVLNWDTSSGVQTTYEETMTPTFGRTKSWEVTIQEVLKVLQIMEYLLMRTSSKLCGTIHAHQWHHRIMADGSNTQ
jgi:hypothetical protein